MGIFSELSHWIVLGLVILIVSFVFFSKTGLMPKVATALLSAVDKWLPIKPDKETIGTSPESVEVLNVRKQLMEDLSNSPGSDKCLLKLRDLSVLNDFEDYSIGVSTNNGKLYSVILRKTGESEAPHITNPITGDQQLQVCVINSKQFYDCYLSDNRPVSDDNCIARTYRVAADGVVINQDKIKLSSSPDADSYDFLQDYVFKPEPDKVCFIPIHGGAPLINDCDAEEFTIDQDCIEKFQQNTEFQIC